MKYDDFFFNFFICFPYVNELHKKNQLIWLRFNEIFPGEELGHLIKNQW